MSPWYVLSTSTDVSLLCAVSKHQCLLAMCFWKAPMSPCYLLRQAQMSPCYMLSASTNVSLQCAVDNHQCLLAMCCQKASMSPCYVLLSSTNVYLVCAVDKHQCLLGMCCRQAPMSSCYVLLASTNVSLLCAVVNYQHLLASCGCRQARRKQLSRDQEGSDGGTCCTVVYLKKLLAPYLHDYDFFMQKVKNIKQTWRTSVSGSVF